MNPRRGAVLVSIAILASVAGCGSDAPAGPAGTADPTAAPALPTGSEPVRLDPADFTAEIDNPWWPMPVGRTWVFRETDADGAVQRIVVTVTDRTTRIMGIDARVVHDVVTEAGRPVEVTEDWYAQDRRGNVWYMGESTREYENGVPTTTAGSWRGGVGGAQPGVVMPADPVPGLAYRQEYLAGEAEDRASVLRNAERLTVPAGSFDDVVVTEDTTPLDPGLVEHKFYARRVGPIAARTISGGTSREVLIELQGP